MSRNTEATDDVKTWTGGALNYKEGFFTQLATDELAKGINEEVVRAISAKRNEPEWMLKFRLNAYRAWLEMEEPHWLKAHYDKLNYQDYSYYSAPSCGNCDDTCASEPGAVQQTGANAFLSKEVEAAFEQLGVPVREGKEVAVDAIFDSVSVATTYREKLAEQGIIFCSFGEAIIVNLAELRLYYYPPGENIVQVYPIGIGLQGLETPVMETRVGQKIPNPTWTPTAGIRQRSLERGIKLPPVVPAGPNNPLGRYALRLAHGNGEYLIHGTSAPDRVGLRVSSGCIRMNAPDIKALFSSVRTGTPVKVINEPVKYSVEPNGMRYVEVHRPLSAEEQQNVQTMPYTLPAGFTQFKDNKAVDQKLVDKALYRRAGYPVSVSSGATPAASNAPSVESAQNGEPEQGNMLRATQ